MLHSLCSRRCIHRLVSCDIGLCHLRVPLEIPAIIASFGSSSSFGDFHRSNSSGNDRQLEPAPADHLGDPLLVPVGRADRAVFGKALALEARVGLGHRLAGVLDGLLHQQPLRIPQRHWKYVNFANHHCRKFLQLAAVDRGADAEDQLGALRAVLPHLAAAPW